MSSIGSLLLGLRGMTDPTGSAIAEILRGGVGTPGAGTPSPAPTGAGPSAPPTGVPTQPARSSLYDSPPDLLDLYSKLSDFQSRQKRIDNGLALAGSAFVHPENRQLVASLFSGDTAVDPLSLTMQLGQFRADQEEKSAAKAAQQRQLNSLPAISDQYGLDPETARYLFDTGNLDEYILEAQKAKAAGRKTEIWSDKSTSKDYLIDQADGTVIKELGGGPSPNKQLVKDESTGQMRVVDINATPSGTNIGGGLAPSADQKLFDEMKAAGTLPPGVDTLAKMIEWKANVKKGPDTQVNIDNSGNKLLAGMDEQMTANNQVAQDNAKLIDELQQARQTANSQAGVVTGSVLSQATSETRKVVAQIFGLNDEAASNTDALMAQLKNVVLPKLKELRPVSDTDLTMVESIVGGSQALTKDTINFLIDVQEKAARKQIMLANDKMQKRIDLESDPATKNKLQAAFDATKAVLPDYTPEQLAVVNPDDVVTLREALTKGDKTAIDDFNKMYGPGMAEQILRGM